MAGRKIRVGLTPAQVDVLASAIAQIGVDWEDEPGRGRDLATLNRAWEEIRRAQEEQSAGSA